MERSSESQARLDYLLKARKGVGLSSRAEPPAGLFGPEGSFWDVVDGAIAKIEHELQREAVKNALGYLNWTQGLLLKDRRQLFMAERGLSLRTVIRYEDRGFERLAEIIDDVLKAENPFEIVENIDREITRLHTMIAGAVPYSYIQDLAAANLAIAEAIARTQEFRARWEGGRWKRHAQSYFAAMDHIRTMSEAPTPRPSSPHSPE